MRKDYHPIPVGQFLVVCILSCRSHGFLRASSYSNSRERPGPCIFGVNSDSLCRSLLVRGGDMEESDGRELGGNRVEQNAKSPEDDELLPEDLLPASDDSKSQAVQSEVPALRKESVPIEQRKKRHSSDVISNILAETNPTDSSHDLRDLVAARAQNYLEDLALCEPGDRPPHPTRFLHYAAPKIPAIKHSPDIMLRVQCSRTDMDPGVAACIIGSVARICESYERHKALHQREENDQDIFSVGSEISGDRRFEQLVECVLCGIDLRRRKEEAQLREENGAVHLQEEPRDIEDVLDEEDATIDAGLSVHDACRAAWGIAILGGFERETIGGERTKDILSALSLRIRERLLARLQLLRQGETLRQIDTDETVTLAYQLELEAQSLAQDAASAMWSFACVKACTGVRSAALIETSCSILCQNPTELREKANANSEGLVGPSFAANDVVERLARSDVDAESDGDEKAVDTASVHSEKRPEKADLTGKDSLLDWLSPNEVTDVLWALALHGSPMEPESKEDHSLSETAAAFREIAFDRLVAWLRCDYEKSQKHDMALIAPMFSEPSSPVEGLRAPEDMIVEVVDAAALLAAASDTGLEAVSSSIGNTTIKGRQQNSEITSLRLADAATLLATTQGEEDIETEVVVTGSKNPSLEYTVSGQAAELATLTDSHDNESSSPHQADLPFESSQLSFSPHDLCSIAWAVTDLRDPLRFLIVDLVSKIFDGLGQESFSGLSGGDLSNLAWAVARCEARDNPLSQGQSADSPSFRVTQWISLAVLERLSSGVDHGQSLLKEFQPPELGRLMWSLAYTMDNIADPFERQANRDPAMSRLATAALHTVGSNISIFGTEDLVRISWAFLQLCENEQSLSDMAISKSLGQTLSVVEASLLLWESGQALETAALNYEKPDDSVRYSTFFGKSRFSLPVLNQRIGDYEVDDDDIIQPYPLNKWTSLPLLRDLSVDPASICKLAAGYAEFGRVHPDFRGGWTLIRVGVRLLSSKNGQLMKQCSTRDIIRLCYACSTNEIHGHGREHVTRLFTRRVLQLLNAAFDKQSEDYISASGRFSRACPWDKVMLLWSLSELGVRHVSADDATRMAHRKFQFATDQDLLSPDELSVLSPASITRLLHSIVSMNMLSSNPTFVRSVLRAAIEHIPDLQRGSDLCALNYSVSKLLNVMGKEEASDNESKLRDGAPGASTRSVEDETGVSSSETDSESSIVKIPSLESELVTLGHRMMSSIATRSIDLVDRLSAKEMRKLLVVYAICPIRADDTVNAIDAQVRRRLDSLASFSHSDHTVDESVRLTAECVRNASTGLLGQDNDSPVSALRTGIISLFRPPGNGDEGSEEAAEFAVSLHRAVSSSQHSAETLRSIREGTGLEPGNILSGKQHGTSLELGRCLELIACYRRINFVSGSRETRYNRTGRKDIGKRVLSRLFPQS